MTLASKFAQRLIKSVPFLYKQIKSAQLARWTKADESRLRFYAQLIGPDNLCFDIGANFGNRVKVFLRLGAQVVAVEPLAECVEVMRMVYGSRRDLTLVNKAVGAVEGESEILIPDVTVLASMSPGWIDAVKKSGRVQGSNWAESRKVSVTTLESLIETYGAPDFMKIDVEGFEFEVIRNLARPVKMLSLEYTSEYIEPTISCIEHIDRIGDFEFNYYRGEDMAFALDKWVGAGEMKTLMRRTEKMDFGDVYARMRNVMNGAGS
jgi:FkbM family methyltransferase